MQRNQHRKDVERLPLSECREGWKVFVPTDQDPVLRGSVELLRIKPLARGGLQVKYRRPGFRTPGKVLKTDVLGPVIVERESDASRAARQDMAVHQGVRYVSATPLLSAEEALSQALRAVERRVIRMGMDIPLLDQQALAALFVDPVAHRKDARVLARLAKAGETVSTVIDSTTECIRTAGVDEVVVTGPVGETYAIPLSVFLSRHDGPTPTTADQEYVAHGIVHAVRWTHGPARIVASWGGETPIEDGDMLCSIDPAVPGNLYRIERSVFERSCRPIEA